MSCFKDVPSVTNDEISLIIKCMLLPRIFSIDLIILLNIPRAPRSKGSHRPTNISDSFPT